MFGKSRMKGSTASHPQLQRCLRHDQIPRKQVTKHHDSWFLPEQRNRFTLGVIPWDACMKPPGDYVSYLGRRGGNSQITPVGWSVGPFVALCASSSSILEKAKSSPDEEWKGEVAHPLLQLIFLNFEAK